MPDDTATAMTMPTTTMIDRSGKQLDVSNARVMLECMEMNMIMVTDPERVLSHPARTDLHDV